MALEYDKVRGARKMKTTELLIGLRDPHHPCEGNSPGKERWFESQQNDLNLLSYLRA